MTIADSEFACEPATGCFPANSYPANHLIKKINTVKKPIISRTGDRIDDQRVLTATMHLPQCGQRAGVGADSTPPQSQINRERRFMI